MDHSKPIVVVGAGAIGCFVGCHWAVGGVNIRFLGRKPSVQTLKGKGLSFSGGTDLTVLADQINAADDVRCLGDARAIVLAVKSTALPQVIDDIRSYAQAETPVVSLLNGLSPVRDLRAALPDFPICAGMVPYNVAWQGGHHLHRSSVGHVALERSDVTQELAVAGQNTGAAVDLYDDLKPIQYGKLLLNLINPVNALSGQTLHAQMSQRGYRLIYAAALQEALGVYRAAGISHQKAAPFAPEWIVRFLRLPDVLFNHTLLRVQKIDKATLTSMASDYQARKPTEIATINGEILHLADQLGVDAPINRALVGLIEAAHSDGWPTYTARELAQAVGV